MYSDTDHAFVQALAIHQGTRQLEPVHRDLVAWISHTFEVTAIDFGFEARQTSKGYRQQVVFVIVLTLADAKRLEAPEPGRALTERFGRFLRETAPSASDPTKSARTIHPVEIASSALLIAPRSLEEITAQVANLRAAGEVAALATKYAPDVRSISTNNRTDHTFWFATDDALSRARAEGLTEAILDDVVSLVRPHDVLGLVGRHSIRVTFDTEEHLDESAGGDLWKYYR